jgi:tetratricopeptide (TPR) repeat protein
LAINPEYVEAYNNLGLAHASLGQHLEAVKAYRQALRLKPDYVESLNNLGMLYYNSASYQEAVKALERALKLKPDYVMAITLWVWSTPSSKIRKRHLLPAKSCLS